MRERSCPTPSGSLVSEGGGRRFAAPEGSVGSLFPSPGRPPRTAAAGDRLQAGNYPVGYRFCTALLGVDYAIQSQSEFRDVQTTSSLGSHDEYDTQLE